MTVLRAVVVLTCVAAIFAADSDFLHWEEVISVADIPDKQAVVPCGKSSSDTDTTKQYVARIFYLNSILPASATKKKGASANVNGDKIDNIAQYEILVADRQYYEWVPSALGDVPANALQTGVSADGEPLFTCRVHNSDLRGYYCGVLEPQTLRCVSLAAKYLSYEVLVEKKTKN